MKRLASALAIIASGVVTALGSGQNTPYTVGAYYYPWWGDGTNPTVGHSWTNTLGYQLSTQIVPTAGYTASSNAATISAQIQQSVEANIGMWAVSWWGTTSNENNNLINSIFTNPNASKLKYAIMYESDGELVSHTTPDYTKLQSDFSYLATHVFNNPNYQKINGRPVVYMYLTRVYFSNNETGTITNGSTTATITGKQALANLKSYMQSTYGYTPYIVGDDIFGTNPVGATGSNIDQNQLKQFDAVTTYDVYGSASSNGDITQTQIGNLTTSYQNMKTAAKAAGVAYIPGVTPGFDNRATGSTLPVAARYTAEAGPTGQGTVFSSFINQSAEPSVDPNITSLPNQLMVTSFNEWHEGTAIEATNVTPLTNTDANGNSGATSLTAGNYFQGWGTQYLDMLRQYTSGDVTCTASGSTIDALTTSNWNTNFVPRYGDRAVLQSLGATSLNIGSGVSWGGLLIQNTSNLTITGSGSMSLTGLVFKASGTTITPPTITVATGSNMSLNVPLTLTDTENGTISGGGSFYATQVTAPNDTANLINLSSAIRVGDLADNAFAGINLVANTNDGITFDLNGHNDSINSFQTPTATTFSIDFGSISGANKLIWVTSAGMSGDYSVNQFQIGLDTLQFGSGFSAQNLSSVTIDGIAYSSTATSSAYWNTDSSGDAQFYNVSVPEPAEALLAVAILLPFAGRRSIARRY